MSVEIMVYYLPFLTLNQRRNWKRRQTFYSSPSFKKVNIFFYFALNSVPVLDVKITLMHW